MPNSHGLRGFRLNLWDLTVLSRAFSSHSFSSNPFQLHQPEGLTQKILRKMPQSQPFSCHLARSWPSTHPHFSHLGHLHWRGKQQCPAQAAEGKQVSHPASVRNRPGPTAASVALQTFICTWDIKHSHFKKKTTQKPTKQKAKPTHQPPPKCYFRDTTSCFKCKE